MSLISFLVAPLFSFLIQRRFDESALGRWKKHAALRSREFVYLSNYQPFYASSFMIWDAEQLELSRNGIHGLVACLGMANIINHKSWEYIRISVFLSALVPYGKLPPKWVPLQYFMFTSLHQTLKMPLVHEYVFIRSDSSLHCDNKSYLLPILDIPK